MVTTLVFPRAMARLDHRAAGALSVTARNVAAARHAAYWWVLLSGFLEPLLYLLSIGVGVGRLVGDIALPDGRLVSTPQFVAPAMLAASAMNGALAETTINFFGKMKFMRTLRRDARHPDTPDARSPSASSAGRCPGRASTPPSSSSSWSALDLTTWRLGARGAAGDAAGRVRVRRARHGACRHCCAPGRTSTTST